MTGEKSKAFWISPTGLIIPVFRTHIYEVINNPEFFGLTVDEIKSTYIKEKEELGIEGKARERIIKNLIQKGWIRIRQYQKKSSWTVNMSNLNIQVIYVLKSWAKEMLESGVSRNDEVIFDFPDKRNTYSMSEISEGKLE